MVPPHVPQADPQPPVREHAHRALQDTTTHIVTTYLGRDPQLFVAGRAEGDPRLCVAGRVEGDPLRCVAGRAEGDPRLCVVGRAEGDPLLSVVGRTECGASTRAIVWRSTAFRHSQGLPW